MKYVIHFKFFDQANIFLSTIILFKQKTYKNINSLMSINSLKKSKYSYVHKMVI